MKFLNPKEPLINPEFRVGPIVDLETAGFFLFQEQGLLLQEGGVEVLSHAEIPFEITVEEMIYVGEMHARPYYAIPVPEDHPKLDTVGLRSLLDGPQPLFQIAGRALQLIQWDCTHQFCGRCGAKTARGNQELVRICTDCNFRSYPRLSPCVIMLVHRGDEIVLAKRPGATTQFYTVQAGFVEVGESAEQAVTREVKEETGLELSHLAYLGSQPWPFPGQLMLGYIAESVEGELTPDPKELEDARWFNYRDLPPYPGPNTIAGKLIRHFISMRNA